MASNRSSLALSAAMVCSGLLIGGHIAKADKPAAILPAKTASPTAPAQPAAKQSTAAKPLPILPVVQGATVTPISPWAWTKTSLTGDNKVYAKMRKQIDTAVSQGRDPQILLVKYRTAAQADPGDPISLFRWAYSAYVTAARQSTSAEILSTISGLSDPKYAVVPVSSYDFNRVRFLIAALTAPNPALADLGRQLLAVNSDDDPVEYALAGILLDAYNPPKSVEALGLAEDLIHQEPTRAEPYALVGEVYYLRWKAHHRATDGEQARQAYLQYVQLAPDSAGFKAIAAKLAAAIGDKLGDKTAKE